jgi:hypothetical protein
MRDYTDSHSLNQGGCNIVNVDFGRKYPPLAYQTMHTSPQDSQPAFFPIPIIQLMLLVVLALIPYNGQTIHHPF